MNYSHKLKKHWTSDEVKTLVEVLPTVKSIKEIGDKIPNHTLNAIKLKASSLRIRSNHFLRISKDELYLLYITQKLSSTEIARIKNVTGTSVLYNLHKFQIPIRPNDESNKLFYIKNPPRRGQDTSGWKGGRTKHSSGYISIYIMPDHPFWSMATERTKHRGYVFEHRLVMAQHLGRPLKPWEIVHHKGNKYPQGSIEDKADNRIENLKLYPDQASHVTHTMFKRELHKRDKEIRLLKWQIKTLKQQLEAGVLGGNAGD